MNGCGYWQMEKRDMAHGKDIGYLISLMGTSHVALFVMIMLDREFYMKRYILRDSIEHFFQNHKKMLKKVILMI